MFERDGYDVTTFRRYESPNVSMIVEARPKKEGFFISVESAASGKGFGEMGIGIDSPCLIPGGVKQEKQ